MGESQSNLFEPQFNRTIKVQTTNHRLTSNAGVVLLREADHRLNIIGSIAAKIHDPRLAHRVRYQMDELLRERCFSMALRQRTQDDCDRMAHDPAFRLAVWNKKGESVIDERLASQPTQSRLIDILGLDSRNVEAVRDGLSECIERYVMATGGRKIRNVTIDIDSFPIEVSGKQKGASYNGYYQKTVYHPLVASLCTGGVYDNEKSGSRLGNGFIHAVLRQGQVHTADGMKRFVDKTHQKAKAIGQHVDYRIDAGYTTAEVMDHMTDAGMNFVGRIKGNARLDALAEPHLRRPVGRPPLEGYEITVELGMHHVDTWKHPQRLILVIVNKPDPKTGQLNWIPNYFFLVTNWSKSQRSATDLLAHYRGRGTFEDRIGECNDAIGAQLSSENFKENEAVMLLALLSFNLSSTCRLELEKALGSGWDLTRFQLSVLKVGGEVVKHSRRLILRVAQSANCFWQQLSSRIEQWSLPSSYSQSHAHAAVYIPAPRHSHQSEVLRA